MVPIFIPIRRPDGYSGIDPNDAIRAFKYAGIFGAALIFAIFLSFKPLSYTVMRYKEVPNVETFVDKTLAQAAATAGFSEVDVRPWGWLFGFTPMKGRLEGQAFPFEAATDSWGGTSFAYRLELAPDGAARLWLNNVPTTEKEASAQQSVISADLKKLLKAKTQYLRDVEYRRTGVLPKK